MPHSCQYCGTALQVPADKALGVYRCEACRTINLLFPVGPDGIVFGEFVLLEEVGQGANAAVCRARRRGEAEVLAVKLFLSTGFNDEHSYKEFKRESEIAAQIVHRNIVRVFSCGEHLGVPYLAIELVEGINMAQYLEEYGPMDPYEALLMGEQVCAALDYVWSSYLMIHRDIKPQNLMLNTEGQVKICDFGMVVPHELAGVDINAVEGTPYYISPECITEGAYQDNRSDIYSLGATMFHLMAGRPPFDHDNIMEVVEARIREDPPDLRRHLPDSDPDLARVLRTMMARNPDDRYVTATECLQDMYRVRQGRRPVLVDRRRPKVNQ